MGGIASDKIAPRRYAHPPFAAALARLLGEAAAINGVAGRAYLDGQVMFDDGDEVIVLDDHGVPADLIVSDHTGSFTEFRQPLEAHAAAYAAPVNRRLPHVANPHAFTDAYLDAFLARFTRMQNEYRQRTRAFDNLFQHLPVDPAGSFAYRWQCVLARLAATDPAALTCAVRSHICLPTP